VWNWRTGECIATHRGHRDGVITLHFDSNLLASGSIDKTVKVWNFQDKSTFCLKGHKDWVNAVRLDSASGTIFSASDDCTVRLWDLDTKACIKIFEGHVGQVQQVLPLPVDYEPDECDVVTDTASSSTDFLDSISPDVRKSYGPAFISAPNRPLPPRYMLSSALDSTIRLWDVSTGRCLKTLFGHLEGVWALAGDTLRVVSGAQDRMVKVWDVRAGKCERTFTGHTGPVTCIGLSDSKMCTGSEDCEVRLHSFKTNDVETGSVSTPTGSVT
jgi:F-box/WD-40 domain protein MET30